MLSTKETFYLLVLLMDELGFRPANGGKGERGFVRKEKHFLVDNFVSFNAAVSSMYVVTYRHRPPGFEDFGVVTKVTFGFRRVNFVFDKEISDLFCKHPSFSSLQYCRKTKQIKLHEQEYVKISDL